MHVLSSRSMNDYTNAYDNGTLSAVKVNLKYRVRVLESCVEDGLPWDGMAG